MSTSTAALLLNQLVSDKELWREIQACLKTAELDSGKRVPRVPGGMRALHQRAESLENIATALSSRGVVLHTKKGQARLRIPKPRGRGDLELVLASGVPEGEGFRVNKKGGASLDLIGLQHAFQLSFEETKEPIRSEGAFLILERQLVEPDDRDSAKRIVLHLAYPARLTESGTFISCEGKREVGSYLMASHVKKPEVSNTESARVVVPAITPAKPKGV